MNESWLDFTEFEITRGIFYHDFEKVVFYEKHSRITRISDWRLSHYWDSNWNKNETYFADFKYKNGDIRSFRIDEEITPIGEQLSLF